MSVSFAQTVVAADDFDPYEQQCEIGGRVPLPRVRRRAASRACSTPSLVVLAVAGLIIWLVRRNKSKQDGAAE